MPPLAAVEKYTLAPIQAREDEPPRGPTGPGVGVRLRSYAQPQEAWRRTPGKGRRPPRLEVQHRINPGLAGELLPMLRDVVPAGSKDTGINPGQSDLQNGEYTVLGSPGETTGAGSCGASF